VNAQNEPDAGGRVLQLAPKLAEAQAARQTAHSARLEHAAALFAQLPSAQRQEVLSRLLLDILTRPSSTQR